jgi:hypothetical protein
MTPEQQRRQSELVAEVAVRYGQLSGEGVVELALVSDELAWALARLREHYLEVQSDDLDG